MIEHVRILRCITFLFSSFPDHTMFPIFWFTAAIDGAHREKQFYGLKVACNNILPWTTKYPLGSIRGKVREAMEKNILVSDMIMKTSTTITILTKKHGNTNIRIFFSLQTGNT